MQPCQAGQRWQWDGVGFTVLHPQKGALLEHGSSNAASCVLSIQSQQGRRALLTGDIERSAEAALVAASPLDLPSDVLLVPHHGSNTSSSLSFVQAVAPSVALVQAGYRNRYGHPAARVLNRYAELGIPLIQSPECGAWRWVSQAPRGSTGRCWRSVQPRYWNWKPSD